MDLVEVIVYHLGLITDDGSPLFKILLQNMLRLLTCLIKETGWTLLENNVEICKDYLYGFENIKSDFFNR